MSLHHIQKNSPRLLPKPAKFEKNPPNGYRVIRSRRSLKLSHTQTSVPCGTLNKDIAPATISSWIKQTILLCYQLSNEDAQQLHQVRAHDVRAFAASKAFQGGVSLDQILSACHWKSHNTFTQFYLKDVAWADADLYHLGPVVAAQHIRE